MEIIVSGQVGRIPRYPYFKVVIVGDQAAVAELPCDETGNENIVYHDDLRSVLARSHPDLAESATFTAGWLTVADGAAVLDLAQERDADGAERIGYALRDWCDTSGVRELTINCASPADRLDATDSSSDDWSLPL